MADDFDKSIMDYLDKKRIEAGWSIDDNGVWTKQIKTIGNIRIIKHYNDGSFYAKCKFCGHEYKCHKTLFNGGMHYEIDDTKLKERCPECLQKMHIKL